VRLTGRVALILQFWLMPISRLIIYILLMINQELLFLSNIYPIHFFEFWHHNIIMCKLILRFAKLHLTVLLISFCF